LDISNRYRYWTKGYWYKGIIEVPWYLDDLLEDLEYEDE
jgi:hypothetical protein